MGAAPERTAEPALVLLGPTASGKTAVALEIAPRLEAEIVSVDSRQVYRGMDIGTATPTPEERARVPHHLIDLVDPGEPYSAGRFRDDAIAAIREIRRRGRRPILVGGTGLYLDALLRGLGPVPARDEAVRSALERRLEDEGAEALHAELRGVDPASAARIHPHDRVRLVRALEIRAITGRPPSELRTWGRTSEDALMVGLRWERSRLYERIDARLAAMMRRGFLEEVVRLREAGYGASSPGLRTPGYRELLAHLERGISLDEAVAAAARSTRHLARRQVQWFRARGTITWLDGSLPGADLCARILEGWTAALERSGPS